MLRKSLTVFALSFLAAAPMAQAEICCYPDCDYAVEFPYVGVLFGQAQVKTSLNVNFPHNSTTPILNDNVRFSQNQFTGGLALGYAARWSCRYYFAAEISSSPIYLKSSKDWTGRNGFAYSSNLQLINFFNADAIPGFFISRNLLLYLRAGVAVGIMKLTQNRFFGDTFSQRNTIAGFRGGVGFDYSFGRRWSTGLDYIYTNYGTQKFDDNNVPGFSGISRFSARTYTNFVGLHINYKCV